MYKYISSKTFLINTVSGIISYYSIQKYTMEQITNIDEQLFTRNGMENEFNDKEMVYTTGSGRDEDELTESSTRINTPVLDSKKSTIEKTTITTATTTTITTANAETGNDTKAHTSSQVMDVETTDDSPKALNTAIPQNNVTETPDNITTSSKRIPVSTTQGDKHTTVTGKSVPQSTQVDYDTTILKTTPAGFEETTWSETKTTETTPATITTAVSDSDRTSGKHGRVTTETSSIRITSLVTSSSGSSTSSSPITSSTTVTDKQTHDLHVTSIASAVQTSDFVSSNPVSGETFKTSGQIAAAIACPVAVVLVVICLIIFFRLKSIQKKTFTPTQRQNQGLNEDLPLYLSKQPATNQHVMIVHPCELDVDSDEDIREFSMAPEDLKFQMSTERMSIPVLTTFTEECEGTFTPRNSAGTTAPQTVEQEGHYKVPKNVQGSDSQVNSSSMDTGATNCENHIVLTQNLRETQVQEKDHYKVPRKLIAYHSDKTVN